MTEDIKQSTPPTVSKPSISSTFLRAVWRNDEAVHFLAIRKPNSKGFTHEPVTLAEVAARLAYHSNRKADVYFACAGYATTHSRTQGNATGAFFVWLDVDTGAAKAAQGQGYSTVDEALAELRKACVELGLPQPNLLNGSGAGLHVYFVLEDWVPKEQWQQVARQLKAVLSKVGFRADPACTADIARVLRIPGTLNHKYDPPKPVQGIGVPTQPIANQRFFQAVRMAHERLLPVPVIPSKSAGVSRRASLPTGSSSAEPLELNRLRSALAVLSPDCDDSEWKFKRIVPLTLAARQHPEIADELRQLAMDWSSGDLAGVPSTAWTTPGNTNKLTGQQVFPSVWERFMGTAYSGTPVTIGTIFHDALEAGWQPKAVMQSIRGNVASPGQPAKGQLSTAVAVSGAGAAVDERLGSMIEPTPEDVALAANVDTTAGGGMAGDVENDADNALTTALAHMDQVIQKCGDDVGVPFEPEALGALVTIRSISVPDYQRIKQKLKEANRKIALTTLEAMVKAHRASGSAPSTHHGYAEDLLRRLTVQGYAPRSCDGSLYVLDGRTAIWEEQPIADIEKKVAVLHDGQPNCTRRTDYSAITQHILALSNDPDFFDLAPAGVASIDGFYSVGQGRTVLRSLTPQDRQRVMLPFSPKPGPMLSFDAFLHETFQSANDGEEASQISRIQEVAGAVMLGLGKRYQKAILFYDPYGRAGKGTLVEILINLVPARYVRAVSPFMWCREYYVVALAGARLNLVGELPDGDALPSAQFKSVLGGDLITGRHPTHRPISFKNEATHVFMSNHMINTRDQSEAFFARWEIIEFPNSRLRSGLPIDPDLAKRIVAAELPVIANWALHGAARLLQQGRYTPSPVHERLMKKWRSANNSVQEFIEEACELGADFHARRSGFYKAYKEWCSDNGRQPFAKARVKELLTNNIGLGVTLVEINGHESFKGLRKREKSEGVKFPSTDQADW